MGPGHHIPYNGFLMYSMVTTIMPPQGAGGGGDCGGDENKLQLDGTMCVSHLAHNDFQTLAIITLTFLSLV